MKNGVLLQSQTFRTCHKLKEVVLHSKKKVGKEGATDPKKIITNTPRGQGEGRGEWIPVGRGGGEERETTVFCQLDKQ